MSARAALAFVVPLVNQGGNVPPIVAVLAELTRRGHAVRVVVPDSGDEAADDRLRQRVADVGATLLERSLSWRPGFVPPPPRGLLGGRTGGWFGPLRHTYSRYVQSLAWADAVSGVLLERPADVVATDVLVPGGLIAAEAAGAASAVLMHAIYIFRPLAGRPPPGPGLLPARRRRDRLRDALVGAAIERVHHRDALPLTNQARDYFSLPRLTRPFEEYDRADRFLILSSARFDFLPHELPANVVYTGFPHDPPGAAEPWAWPWPPGDDRPTILVSLSTNEQGQLDLLQRLVSALGEMPVRALISTGPALRGRTLRAPGNVVVRAWVPHELVLPRADLVVTHGGHGTVMKSLHAGVPVLCVPLTADQPDVAARVVARGLGGRISKRAGPAALRAAIGSLLRDPTVRTRVRDLAAQLKTEDGARVAADELERVGWAARERRQG